MHRVCAHVGAAAPRPQSRAANWVPRGLLTPLENSVLMEVSLGGGHEPAAPPPLEYSVPSGAIEAKGQYQVVVAGKRLGSPRAASHHPRRARRHLLCVSRRPRRGWPEQLARPARPAWPTGAAGASWQAGGGE